MAKYEDEGYCPATDVQDKLSKHDNQSLYGLWNLFKDSVVYEKEDCLHHPLNPEVCNDVFSYDPISAKVLETIVRTNVNAEKILVHQLYEYDDFLFEIKELVCNSSNSKLILAPGSNFAVVISDAPYGLDVWVCDLRALDNPE